MRNRRTDALVAAQLLPAFESDSRRRGLLGRDSLEDGAAMLIAPTNAIHTFFMRFPIDVAFVAKNGRILKISPGLRPWRITASWGGYAVIEMAAGAFARSGTEVGDVVSIESTERL